MKQIPSEERGSHPKQGCIKKKAKESKERIRRGGFFTAW
jgi:hypothetical protein